jgi:hypothetical protein
MAGDGNMNAHVTTYGKVTTMMKWGSVAVAIVTALVIWLIAR